MTQTQPHRRRNIPWRRICLVAILVWAVFGGIRLNFTPVDGPHGPGTNIAIAFHIPFLP